MGEVTIILFRALISFVTLLIFSRILGKSQISQLTFFEYVTGITIGSISGSLTTDLSVRPWPTFVGLVAWTVMALGTQWAQRTTRWVAKMIDSQPVILVQNGQILEQNLFKQRMTVDELTSLLRIKNVFDVKQVEFALLEPRGELSICLKSQNRPVTPDDLKIPTQYEGIGIEVIVEGKVVTQNLRQLHLNQAWLKEQLRSQGVYAFGDVFLAILDTQGKLYVDRYRDVVPEVNDIGDYPGPN
ncbi:MAG: YetF domain-containing protein [Mycobacterium leprae]